MHIVNNFSVCHCAHEPSDWCRFKLSPEQVDRFWQEGYLTNIPVLSEEQCDKILLDYQRLIVSRTVSS